MTQGDFSAWGIQSGPLAALEANFVLTNFLFVSPLYWKANYYCPRGLIVRKGILTTPEMDETGNSVPGAFKLDHLQPLKLIWF